MVAGAKRRQEAEADAIQGDGGVSPLPNDTLERARLREPSGMRAQETNSRPELAGRTTGLMQ